MVRTMIWRRRWLLILATPLAVLGILTRGGGGVVFLLFLAAGLFLLLRVAPGPMSRLIARLGVSIRWKILAALFMVAALVVFVSAVSLGAMNYMHEELHEIQELGGSRPDRVLPAVNALERTQHGLLDLTPFLALLGSVAALALGIAIAWSVIDAVRRMGEGMRRIASGDFTQPVQVENRDELGELTDRMNQTARELAKLREATLAAERARALQERITQVTQAQEEERRRISRELHDGLGPSLAALGNRIRACLPLVRADPQRAEAELEEMAKSLRDHIQEIRALIYDLRPLALDQLGLVEALRQQVERFSQDTGIEATFSTAGEVALDPLADVTVFRIVQECLSNIQKHAEASRVEVRLEVMDGSLEVRVTDNGQGFDRHEATGKGMGLASMRERAELLGGSLSVQSSPEQGCRVAVHVPYREVKVGAHSSPPGR